MNVWNKFWKEKGHSFEWTPSDILEGDSPKHYSRKVLKLLGKRDFKETSLLELGSGMGTSAYFFASKGTSVTLLDSSKEVKKLAQKFWGDLNFKFVCEDLFKYNPKEKYDIVSSFGLCEHFVGLKRQEILQKHFDLAKRGGVCLISVPYKYGIFYRAQMFLQKLLGFWSFGLEVPFSKKEFRQFGNENGGNYEIIMSGFWSSAYDLVVRKPLKVLKIPSRRRFDKVTSIFDYSFGSGMMIILKK